ncbi:MAG TPA: sialidase family protein [Thermodesulfobacteriota bacterium]|nr:sialidase family protein [Thermodesulfobacteriota bacterium]
MKIKNPVILIAALVIVLGAMLYLHSYSKRGGEAEAPQGTANAFTLGERIEIPHAGYGHEVHVSGPSVAADGEGGVYVAWIAAGHDSNDLYVVKPVTGEEKPVRVNPGGLSVDSVHQSPGIVTGPGGEVYVSWASSKDKPEGVVFANDLRLSRSLDGGKSFDAPIMINEDRPISHTFEGIAATGSGDVIAAWIDSRGGWDKPATFLTTVSGKGAAVGKEVKFGGETCVCCRVSVAAADGKEAALWRGVAEGNVRNMVLALGEGGEFEQAVVHDDGWKLESCPHRGGEVAIGDDGEVYVIWYTEGTAGVPEILFSRSETAAMPAPLKIDSAEGSIPDQPGIAVNDKGRVAVVWEDSTAVRRSIKMRFSADGGKTFGEPVVISKAIKSFMPDVAAAPDGRFVVVWHEEHFPSIRTIVQFVEPGA